MTRCLKYFFLWLMLDGIERKLDTIFRKLTKESFLFYLQRLTQEKKLAILIFLRICLIQKLMKAKQMLTNNCEVYR